ncbi:OsmC family peroxiredoxin [Herbiconiux sp.]|uniref:OsmC family peroxiredoxin n=1 Tax=Herbiconiux sp. TaxID=1871186 RepID=UPI0025C670B9|nr:OsmC family peroxiredoxin [Herbiconiux sp.]
MTVTSEATTLWHGDLISGSGTTTLDSSGAAGVAVNWRARSEGTASAATPEELLGAAHASCFSMGLASALAANGTPLASVQTTAAVTLDPAEGVTGTQLLVSSDIPGITEADFQRIVEETNAGCPVYRALAGTPITLEAGLV